MRVLGSLFVVIAIIIHAYNQFVGWIDKEPIHPSVILGLVLIGSLIIFYDYRYNVIPSWDNCPRCPLCGSELWVSEDGHFLCSSCNREY